MKSISRRHCCHALLAIAGLLVTMFPTTESASQVVSGAEEMPVVKLTIDYDDGVTKQFTKLEWKEGLTVLGALQQAAKHPRGIKPAIQGSGEFTLVIAIDELKNEGNGKNWMYKVNGKFADRSCGIHKLAAGDEVTWVFTDMKP